MAPSFIEEDIIAIEATYDGIEPPVEGEESEIYDSELNNTRKYIYTNGVWTFVSSSVNTTVLAPLPAPIAPIASIDDAVVSDSEMTVTVSDTPAAGEDEVESANSGAHVHATTKKPRKPRTTEFVAACNRIIGAIDAGKNNDAKEFFKSFVDKFIGNRKLRKVRKPKEVDENGQVKCRSFYNQFVSDTLRELTSDHTVHPKDRMRITMERWHAYKATAKPTVAA